MRKSIYISASVKDIEYAKNVFKILANNDFIITSSWVSADYSQNTTDPIDDVDLCINHALKDLYDIDIADIVIFLASPSKSAGKNIEFGYALAKGKKIYCIGEINSIFHNLAIRYATIEEWLGRERNDNHIR